MEQIVFRKWKIINKKKGTLFRELPVGKRWLAIASASCLFIGAISCYAFIFFGLTGIINESWRTPGLTLSFIISLLGGILSKPLFSYINDNEDKIALSLSDKYYADIHNMLKEASTTDIRLSEAICDALKSQAAIEENSVNRHWEFAAEVVTAVIFIGFIEVMHIILSEKNG